jgi:hypothetical protein
LHLKDFIINSNSYNSLWHNSYNSNYFRPKRLTINYYIFFYIFKVQEGLISVKNHRTMTKFKLDLCIPMTYIKFELIVYNFWGDNEWKLKISYFSKWKGHNSAKNHRTMTKFELDQCIPLTYQGKFELNVYNCWEDYKQKLNLFKKDFEVKGA